MCKYSSDKELNKLVRKLVAKGWAYERRRKHGFLNSSDKQFKTSVPGSPSDRRAFINFKQDIYRLKNKIEFHTKQGEY